MSDTADFFRGRIDQTIDLRHPLAVLTARMPWQAIEASIARQVREGKRIEGMDLFGPSARIVGAGIAKAGRPRLGGLLRPLIDQELAIAFYDLTTIRVEGSARVDGDVRQHGMTKDGTVRRQVLLGVVQTADGLPIHHEVYEGNAAETRTLVPTIEKVLKRFAIRRVVLMADRGLLSLDNLEALEAIRVGDRPLEFILAVPARRYAEFDSLLANFHTDVCASATEEVFGALQWQGHRLIVAHRPDQAAERTARRRQRIAELEHEALRMSGKLKTRGGSEGRQ